MPSYENFEINIVLALAEQLVAAFERLEADGLSEEALSALPEGKGVYQLHHQGALVYVGKADDNLRKRLSQHRGKIIGRRNISVEDVGFKCLYLHENWNALAPEESLITHYRDLGQCEWNGIGFGNHDVGRERDTTNKPPDGFDVRYPIRADWVCNWVLAGGHNALELLISLKDRLPYLLRYETNKAGHRNKGQHYTKGHADYNDFLVRVSRDGMTAVELLRTIAQQLEGWQATLFPSHMILYKERRKYPNGEVIWPLSS